MMRQVIGFVTGILMVSYFFYLVYPLFYNESNNLPSIVNMTDPVIINSTNLGTGFYNVLPAVPVLAGIFLLINYALKRDDS